MATILKNIWCEIPTNFASHSPFQPLSENNRADSTTIPFRDQIIMISKISENPKSKKCQNLQTTTTDEITIVRHAAADTIHSVHNDQVAEAVAADNGPELGPDTMSAASYRLHPQSLDRTEPDG
jgi:hypothetical protein